MNNADEKHLSFGMELRKIRIGLNLTQKGFCAMHGLSLPTYKAWELGKQLPNFENFTYLSRCISNMYTDYTIGDFTWRHPVNLDDLKIAYEKERSEKWLSR